MMKDAWKEWQDAGRGGPIGRALLTVIKAHIEQALGGADNTGRLEELKSNFHAAISGAIVAGLSTVENCPGDRRATALDIVAMYLDEAGSIFKGAALDYAEKSFQMQQQHFAEQGAGEQARPWNWT